MNPRVRDLHKGFYDDPALNYCAPIIQIASTIIKFEYISYEFISDGYQLIG